MMLRDYENPFLHVIEKRIFYIFMKSSNVFECSLYKWLISRIGEESRIIEDELILPQFTSFF